MCRPYMRITDYLDLSSRGFDCLEDPLSIVSKQFEGRESVPPRIMIDTQDSIFRKSLWEEFLKPSFPSFFMSPRTLGAGSQSMYCDNTAALVRREYTPQIQCVLSLDLTDTKGIRASARVVEILNVLNGSPRF